MRTRLKIFLFFFFSNWNSVCLCLLFVFPDNWPIGRSCFRFMSFNEVLQNSVPPCLKDFLINVSRQAELQKNNWETVDPRWPATSLFGFLVQMSHDVSQKRVAGTFCELNLASILWAAAPLNYTKAVVVVQVVEQRQSVRTGRVLIPGWTWLSQFSIAVNLFSMGVGLSLRRCNRMVHTPSSSFLFSIIIYHCKIFNCNWSIFKERENKSKKRLGKANF